MNDAETKLLAYVGRGFGAEAVVVLRDKRSVKFRRDGVLAVPPADAEELLRNSPGQFALVDTLPDSAKRHSIKADRLAKLAEQGKLHWTYYFKRGQEPQMVVFQDEQTAAGIVAEHERAAKAKEKE